jgi:GNAT superfamily N-acetyltransferase
VALHRVGLDDERVKPLLTDLEREYLERYGPGDEMASTDAHQFEPPGGLFVVAVEAGVTVAGGGFRRHGEGVCEVKRMWTHPAHRRRGLAAAVLDVLEDAAAAAGYERLVLETGPRQPEAAAMYERRGYGRIDAFGPYEVALAFATDLPRRSVAP